MQLKTVSVLSINWLYCGTTVSLIGEQQLQGETIGISLFPTCHKLTPGFDTLLH